MHLLSQCLGRITPFLTEVIVYLLTAFLRIRINLNGYEAFLFCTQEGKQPMRSYSLK